MGSTLTKDDLIKRILKATDKITKETLNLLPMKDLWTIERAINIDKGRNEGLP